MSLPQQPTDEVFRFAIAQVTAGVRPFDVQRQLVANGWDPQTAASVVHQVRQTLETQQTLGAGKHGTNAVPKDSVSTHHPSATVRSAASACQSESLSTMSTGDRGASRGKIPWSAYRDLLVGGIFLLGSVAMVVAKLHPIGCAFTLLFGLIQTIRGAIVIALSRYEL